MIIEDHDTYYSKKFEPRVGDIGVEIDMVPELNNVKVKVLFDIIGLEAPVNLFIFIRTNEIICPLHSLQI